MIKSILLASAIAVVAAPAQAQDFTGGYAGIGVGYLSVSPEGIDDTGGPSFGIHAGYTYDYGTGFVLGGELEADWTQLEFENDVVEIDNILRGKLILGYNAGGGIMPYAVVGGAQVNTGEGSGTGWLGGAGLSFLTDSPIAVSGEILYHDFQDIGDLNAKASATVFNIRASYRF